VLALLVLTSVICACIVRPRRDMRKCDEMREYVRQRHYTPYCEAAQCGHVHGKSDFTLRLHARAANGEINNSAARLFIIGLVPHRYFKSPTFTFPVSPRYFHETCRHLSRQSTLKTNITRKVSNNNYGKIKFVKASKI